VPKVMRSSLTVLTITRTGGSWAARTPGCHGDRAAYSTGFA
jgi:hypothetical protein